MEKSIYTHTHTHTHTAVILIYIALRFEIMPLEQTAA